MANFNPVIDSSATDFISISDVNITTDEINGLDTIISQLSAIPGDTIILLLPWSLNNSITPRPGSGVPMAPFIVVNDSVVRDLTNAYNEYTISTPSIEGFAYGVVRLNNTTVIGNYVNSTKSNQIIIGGQNQTEFKLGDDVEVIDFAGIQIYTGTGSPEGVVTAPPGSLYSNKNGGAGTTLYVKESGTSNTGWVGK